MVVELDWFAAARLGSSAFLAFLDDIEERRLEVLELVAGDYRRVRDLIARYGDLPLGFVDAAVLSVAERLREPKVMTLDHRHFGVVRPRHVPRLRLLP